MTETTDQDNDCIVFEYPEDYRGGTKYVVVLDELQESPFVDGKTEFLGCEYYEDYRDYIKLIAEDGEAFWISKSNIDRIVRGDEQ